MKVLGEFILMELLVLLKKFNPRIPCTIKTDTQGCGAGLADTKLSPFIDITLFETETQKTKVST